MKIAFFVSSIGDTDLALGTIKAMEQQGHDIHLIPLSKTAQQRIEPFKSTTNITISDLVEYNDECLTQEQAQKLKEYINKTMDYAFIGVPSTNSAIPFQIAELVENIPVLMAYEFMFKPTTHKLWSYLPQLKSKPNLQWAVPLASARDDFGTAETVHLCGHLSIDSAYSQNPPTKSMEEIHEALQLEYHRFAFLSSTTQPVETDLSFLEHVLAELPKNPSTRVRLGLHPGIQDLDAYLLRLLNLIRANPNYYKTSIDQFKVIMPDNLASRLKQPELTLNNPLFKTQFIRTNINGNEAAYAADIVAQAVPGALLNQAALEGKPAYSHSGTPYLPTHYFANTIHHFFDASRQPIRTKKELGLKESSAGENCAQLISDSQSFTARYAAAIRKIKSLGVGAEPIVEAMRRLEVGKNNYWNPYWMNSGKKLERIIQAIQQINSTDTIDSLLHDSNSAFYKALNMQRIAPITFLGSLGLNRAKTLQYAQTEPPRAVEPKGP